MRHDHCIRPAASSTGWGVLKPGADTAISPVEVQVSCADILIFVCHPASRDSVWLIISGCPIQAEQSG